MRDRILYILAGLFFLTALASAQESSPTDNIVIKATNAVIFQMTANLKLSQDQIDTIEPIVAQSIAKARNLQQSLEDGTIDGPTMYSQRQQLINDENEQLGSILTADQMKLWVSMQNDSDDNHGRHASSK